MISLQRRSSIARGSNADFQAAKKRRQRPEARQLIDDLFEEEALVLGGIVAARRVDDEIVWRPAGSPGEPATAANTRGTTEHGPTEKRRAVPGHRSPDRSRLRTPQSRCSAIGDPDDVEPSDGPEHAWASDVEMPF